MRALGLGLLLLGAACHAGETWPAVHDPSLLRQGDTTWVFSTGEGLQRLRSDDGGRHWTRVAPVFRQAPAWWAEAVPAHAQHERGLDVWAPKVFAWRERLWVLYAISTFGQNHSAIGLASVPLSQGPGAADWRDDGPVLQSRAGDDFNAIDADFFVDRDGRPWMSWGSWWQGLRLTALDPDTLRPVGEARFIARRRGGIEAPTLVQRGDWVYLFMAWNRCCRGVDSDYELRVGRARSVHGPFVDRDGQPLMDGGGSLLLAGAGRWAGPGHQDVVGDTMVWHAYDREDGGRPKLQQGRLRWSADGWPALDLHPSTARDSPP